MRSFPPEVLLLPFSLKHAKAFDCDIWFCPEIAVGEEEGESAAEVAAGANALMKAEAAALQPGTQGLGHIATAEVRPSRHLPHSPSFPFAELPHSALVIIRDCIPRPSFLAGV